jgi:hypothetical protein
VYGAAVVNFALTNQGTLAAIDDISSSAVNLGIGGASGINFFGQKFTQTYVNDNGNITFGSALGQFTPTGFATGVGLPIIAPFWADVDTEGAGSGLVTYGNATYNGFAAFVVDYPNVGYSTAHTNKLINFQVILTDRSDTGAGNFDIEFNYNKIQWETGDFSGGTGGLGGDSAAVGYSNGQFGASNVYNQLTGSLVNGALLDGGPDSLIAHDVNSSVAGRYDFQVRNGLVVSGAPEPFSIGLFGAGFLGLAIARRKSKAGK